MKTKKLFLLAAMLLMSVCSFAQSKYLYIGPVEPTAENYKTLATEVTSYNDYYEYENNTGQKCNVYVLVAEEISVSMRDPASGWGGQVTTLEFTSADIPGHKVVRTGGRLAIGGRAIIDLGDEWKHFYLGTTQPTADNYEALTPAFSSLPAMDGATVQVPSSGKIYLLVPYSNSPSQSLLKHCFINNEGKTVTYTERNCDDTSIYRHYIWELSFEPGTVLKYNYLTVGFNNQTLYTLTCKRGALVMNAEGTGLAAGQTRTNAPEEDKRFAIITYNGKRYLYSPSVKQYLLADGRFVSRLGSPITFDDSKAEGEYKFMISTPGTNGETWYFNNNNGNIDINSWGTPDDGNRWLIESCVLNIDLSEALALAAEQPITVTADDKTMTYGDDVPELTYTSTWTVNGTPKISTTATKTSPAGTYPIKVEKGTLTNEYVSYVNGTLTINQAWLTVGVQNVTITEGDAIPAFTLTYSGWRNNDSETNSFTTKPKAATTATSASKPGTYPITLSGGEAQNYALTYTQGTLTITAKAVQPVTITADNKTMTYGDNVPTLTYKSSGATLNGTPKLSTTATKTSPVGTYPIKVEKGTVTNEQVTCVDGTLTIGKAPLTVGVQNVTITEGDAIPTFTLTYNGFRNNDTESNAFTTKPKATTTATSASKPGTYPITVSGGEAKNYALTYTSATLTILQNTNDLTSRVGITAADWQATGLIDWAGPKITTRDGRETALAEVYEVTTENTGTVMEQTVTGLKNGAYVVTVYANSLFTPGRGFGTDITDGQKDVAYVFANEAKTYIVVHIGESVSTHGEYTLKCNVTNGQLRIGLATEKAGTNWHSIQIKSLDRIGEVNGIQQLSSEPAQDNRVYNLGGQRLEKPRKGINIIGGKKVFVP